MNIHQIRGKIEPKENLTKKTKKQNNREKLGPSPLIVY